MQRIGKPVDVDASDISTATETYAKLNGQSEASEVNIAAAITSVSEPIVSRNQPVLNDNDNFHNLIVDIERYLTELRNKPATDHPVIAVLVPIIAWVAWGISVLVPGLLMSKYKSQVGSYPLGSPEYIEAVTNANKYEKIAGYVGYTAGTILAGITILYLIFVRRIYHGPNLSQEEWNGLRNNLQTHVIRNLVILNSNEERQVVAEFISHRPELILVDSHNFKKLNEFGVKLTQDQPRTKLIAMFASILNILQTLPPALNNRNRSQAVMFQPAPLVPPVSLESEDMGLADLFSQPDLEAGMPRLN